MVKATQKERYRYAFAEAAEEILRLRAWLEYMELMTDDRDPEHRADVLARKALDGAWPDVWLQPDTRPPEDQPPIAAAERERLVRALLGTDDGDA
jgi:hypothetical protein